jgi:hypothetical protein
MNKSYLILLTLLTALFSLTVAAAHAQDEGIVHIGYYIAADSSGIRQVYQQMLENTNDSRQITHAASDIINFGVAYDGLSIAYLTSDQLWLQPIHTDEAEPLAPITATQFLSSPVYSPDGQFIAYTDNGVWLLDLGTRVSHQILENVALTEDASNAREFRIYQPNFFVPGDDGKAAQLIVDIGVWEWSTSGVYDLATGELQELAVEDHLHTSLLPLSDGRVLLYGNNGMDGQFALHMAESLDDINTYTKVLDFSEVTDATLWANQAVEIAPGVVRIYGPGIATDVEGHNDFYFDYDVNTDTASEVHAVTLTSQMEQNVLSGPLSPDATIVSVYVGTLDGDLKLLDLATGETIAADFPTSASAFHWQP